VGFDAGNAKGGLLGGGGFSSPWLPGWGRSGGMRRREERERDPLGLPGSVEKKKIGSRFTRGVARGEEPTRRIMGVSVFFFSPPRRPPPTTNVEKATSRGETNRVVNLSPE